MPASSPSGELSSSSKPSRVRDCSVSTLPGSTGDAKGYNGVAQADPLPPGLGIDARVIPDARRDQWSPGGGDWPASQRVVHHLPAIEKLHRVARASAPTLTPMTRSPSFRYPSPSSTVTNSGSSMAVAIVGPKTDLRHIRLQRGTCSTSAPPDTGVRPEDRARGKLTDGS